MILTAMFRQLVPTTVSKIYSACGDVPRLQIPNRASTLGDLGLDQKMVKALQKNAQDGIEEAMMVAVFLMSLFSQKPFAARNDLNRWLKRKGGLSEEKEALCHRLAAKCQALDHAIFGC